MNYTNVVKKFFFSVVPGLTIVIVGLILVSYNDVNARFALLLKRAEGAREAFDQHLQAARNTALFCSQSPHLIQEFDLEKLSSECKRLADQTDTWINIIEVGKTHAYWFASNADLVRQSLTYPRSNEYSALLDVESASRATGKPAISDIFIGRASSGALVAVGQFVRNTAGREFMVYSGFSIKSLSQSLESLKVTSNASVSLVDSQKRIVANSSKSDQLIFELAAKWLEDISSVSQQGTLTAQVGSSSIDRKWDIAFTRVSSAPGWIAVSAKQPPYGLSALKSYGYAILIAAAGIFTAFLTLLLLEKRDIAEKRIKDAELSKAIAERKSQEKSRLLAALAHDIRSPLISLLGSLRLIDVKHSEDTPSVQIAIRSAQGLLQLVDDILELSYLGSGELVLRPSPTDLRELTADIISDFQFQANNKGLQLKLQIDDKIPSTVLVDRMRLQQLIRNLVSNAVKYTEEGTVRLSLKRTGGSENISKIRFSVCDTGIGMEKDDISKIFREFGTLEDTGTAGEKSTGLGLAICQRIITRMGSRIDVESTPGQGSLFYFSLELYDMTDSVGESMEKDRSILPTGLRVLLAEDEPIIRDLLKRQLADAGAEVEAFANGEELLSAFCRTEVDLILIDLEMPVLDGVETILKLRGSEINYQGPIFVLTSHIVGPRSAEALQAGATDILTKPLQVKVLSAAFAARRGGHGRNTPSLLSQSKSSERQHMAIVDKFVFLDLAECIRDDMREHYIPDFASGNKTALNEMSKFMNEKDLLSASEIAHTQKGLCMAFGATRLANLYAEFESHLEDNAETPALALLKDLEWVTDQTVVQFHQLLLDPQ